MAAENVLRRMERTSATEIVGTCAGAIGGAAVFALVVDGGRHDATVHASEQIDSLNGQIDQANNIPQQLAILNAPEALQRDAKAYAKQRKGTLQKEVQYIARHNPNENEAVGLGELGGGTLLGAIVAFYAIRGYRRARGRVKPLASPSL